MTRTEILGTALEVLSLHGIGSDREKVDDVVNILERDRYGLFNQMVSDATGADTIFILEEIHVTNCGRAMAYIVFMCHMYEKQVIDIHKFILDMHKLSHIMIRNGVDLIMPDHILESASQNSLSETIMSVLDRVWWW